MLLESDPTLPSIVSLVTGKPIAGSWWGHPTGGAIYREANRLADRSDVVCMKLLNGKVTFVHKTLWPHVYAVGTCGEPWQVSGLKAASQNLLKHVRRNGLIRTDDPKSRAAAVNAPSYAKSSRMQPPGTRRPRITTGRSRRALAARR